MANEQAELRVLNLTPEGKEVQLNFFFFFFGLDLPPFYPVTETI